MTGKIGKIAKYTTLLGTTILIFTTSSTKIASETRSNEETNLSGNKSIIENSTVEIAKVYSHQWLGKNVTTLQVKNIPIFTFIGDPIDSINNGNTQEISLKRARIVADKINQINLENFDAQEIIVSWDAIDKSYNILIGDGELISINEKTVLPDTTNDLAIDALQATNRLRRLLGGAKPLAEIHNMPENYHQSVATVVKPTINPPTKAIRAYQGMASWYGPKFHGRLTANGERYNQYALTAAHRSLPFGTRVRVTNLNNGRSIVVRINDRGPFIGGRIIDLSLNAAKRIGMYHSGLAQVKVEILED